MWQYVWTYSETVADETIVSDLDPFLLPCVECFDLRRIHLETHSSPSRALGGVL